MSVIMPSALHTEEGWRYRDKPLSESSSITGFLTGDRIALCSRRDPLGWIDSSGGVS